MAHLIRKAFPGGMNGKHFPKAHAFPMPVIHYRDPWFQFKYDFANWIVNSWDMEVFDYPPYATGVKTKDDRIELVARYAFANQGDGIDMPKNVEDFNRYPRRDYICGLNDWMLRPKMRLLQYPWDLVFIGHKSSDVDPFEGALLLKYDSTMCGDVRLAFPLRHWTDEDVWDYTEANHIPFQRTRYENRKDLDETWWNPDWTHACTKCIDPRESAQEVFCPKLKRNVPNRSSEIIQLRDIPAYVG